jgi:5'-nucleotidase
MRVLLCNDDGIDAPGLRVLADAARALDGEIWIVAPERKWTAASHHVSFDSDIVLTRRGTRTYSCSGTPVDSVIAAMTVLDGDGLQPDLVLAGINDKRNVGEDVGYSGTIAIAREATFWGAPAISLSRDSGPDDAAQDTAAIGRLLQLLWNRRAEWLADGTWLGVNLPRTLPAPIRQASIAHDKIASAADVLTRVDDRVVYRLRRGRVGKTHSGDENALLQSGAIVLVRYTWKADLPLSAATLDDWNRALE